MERQRQSHMSEDLKKPPQTASNGSFRVIYNTSFSYYPRNSPGKGMVRKGNIHRSAVKYFHSSKKKAPAQHRRLRILFAER